MADVANPARPVAPSMDGTAWATLLLLGAIWGGSFFFARIAVAEIAPLTLVLLRVAIAAAALHLWLIARGIRFMDHRASFGAFAVLGLVNNVIPFSLIFYGQTEIGAGLASRASTESRMTVAAVSTISGLSCRKRTAVSAESDIITTMTK